MKPLVAGLALLVLAAAFALGWSFAPEPPAPLPVLGRHGGAAGLVADPAAAARLDVALLSRSLADPPVAPSALDEGAARPAAFRPAEPDLAYLFRRQLSAVVADPAGAPYALLRDEGGTRTLRPGQVFQNGWKLSALSMGEAAFVRGKEVRTVGLFDPAPAAPAAAGPDAPAASSPPEGAAAPPLA